MSTFAKLEGLERRADRADRRRRRARWRGCSPTASSDKAEAYLDRLQALFPDRLYIEISRAAAIRSRKRPRTR